MSSSTMKQPILNSNNDEFEGIGTNYDAPIGAAAYQPIANAPIYNDPEAAVETKFGSNLSQSSAEVRLSFVRKVYSILTVQVLFTTVFSAAFLYSPSVQDFAQKNQWLLFMSMFGSLGLLVCLIWKRKSHPINLYLLAAFTLFESYTIGFGVSIYDSENVLKAVILTFALFIGLTLFTFQTKIDFCGIGPFLFGALWVIIIASFIQIFLPFNKFFDLILAIFMCIIFCGYIVYDTQMIFERLSPEEYVIASVELYLDLINLFLAILRILEDSKT